MKTTCTLRTLAFTLFALTLPVRAQFVSRLGETRANTYTTFDQVWGNAAMDADGDFVVVWASAFGQDGSGWGVYAQRYNAAGGPQGVEFRVNTTTEADQVFPAVAMDADGDFVVVWECFDLDGSYLNVHGQRYNSAGVPQGGQFRVNTHSADAQHRGAVAMDADGDFVVTWTSNGQDGSEFGVYAQRFNAGGVAQGLEFRVNTTTVNDQHRSSVAMDANGDFVVAWENEQVVGDFDIYAQRYNAAGVAQGGEFRVNTTTANTQGFPSVAMDADGDFVVAWDSLGNESGYGIYAQRYNASGVPQGGEFRVNTTTAEGQTDPSVAMTPAGDFVVAWSSFGQDAANSSGVYAQCYDAAGQARGGEFRVNTTTANAQGHSLCQLAVNAAGDYVIPWSSQLQDGNGSGVYFDKFFVDNVTQPPVLTAPADGAMTKSPIAVTYTLPEMALAGSVEIKFHDFSQNIEVFITPDAAGHTAGEHTLNIVAKLPGSSPGVAASTGGAIFNGSYSVILSYQDAAGNAEAFDFNLNVTVDSGTGTPTLFLPFGGATYTGPIPVHFQLPEAALPGSVKLTFQGATTVVLTLEPSQETPGSHSFDFAADDPADSTAVLSGGPLPNGVYTVTLSYRDALGNMVAQAMQSPVTIMVPPPELATALLYAKGDTLPTAGVDPNIPAGAVWHSFGIPTIDDAGKVAFVAKWKNPAGSPQGSYGTGIFVNGALRIYAGQEVPEVAGATFKKFRDPVMSNDHLALLATIEGPGVVNTNDTVVLWVRPDGEMTVVAREGFTLNALADGATIKSFKGVHIVGAPPVGGPTGILYTVTLNQGSGTPAVTSANDTAALLERSESYLVAREGGSATGLDVVETIKSFTLLKAISGSPQQTRGHSGPEMVHFTAKLSSGRQALLEHFEGSTSTNRLTGETVGGGRFPEATWKSFRTLSDNREDDYAMKAVITGGGVPGSSAAGIFYTIGSPDDTWENVAFVGDGAGLGLTFKSFKDPVLQGGGGNKLAFATKLVDGSGATLDALYWTPTAPPTLLALYDSPAPGGGHFAKFTSLAYPGGGIGPIFLASLLLGVDGIDKTNDIGLWVTDSIGTLHKAVREGDVIAGKTIKTLTVLKTVSGTPGTTHAFNAAGAIVSRAAFTDGSSGILKTSVP